MPSARHLSGVIALLAAVAAQAGPVFRTVVLSGASAPGFPAGVTFDFLSDPRVNNAGQVLFFADLAGPGITASNDSSIWSDRTGVLTMLYRKGGSTGQGPTSVWAAIPGPAFNSAGLVEFTGALVDTAQSNQPINLGIFAEDNTMVLQKIAREGEAAPPPSTTNWLSLTQAAFSDGGLLAFNASISFPQGGSGVWSGVPGQTPTLIALNGAAAPGFGALVFDSLDAPAQTPGAALLFRGAARSTSVPNTIAATGLWTNDSNGLALVAGTQTAAPGTPFNFSEFAIHPPLTAKRATAFWARIASPNTANDEGIWSGPIGALSLAVREGDQAPGCPAGVVLRDFGRRPATSRAGTVAFTARLVGPGVDASSNSGLWSIAPGATPMLLAREGSQVPRLPAGTRFAGLGDPFMNDAGQLAFLARLAGPGVDSSNNQVLFITDRIGLLYPLLRTGQLFDTGSGPPRLIDEIIFDSDLPQSGRSQFADTAAGGTVICKLIFRDPAAPPASAYSSAIITASLRCLTDFDGNGSVGVNDFVGFVNAFAAQDLLACDFSGNGSLEVLDFIGFLNAAAVRCQ